MSSTPEITDPQLVQDAFKLNPNDVRVINGHDAQYIVKLVERKPSYLPKLGDIEPKVRAALVRQMAEAKALEQATAFLKQVKDPAGFAAAAAAGQARDAYHGRFLARRWFDPRHRRVPRGGAGGLLAAWRPRRSSAVHSRSTATPMSSRSPDACRLVTISGKRRRLRSRTSCSSSVRRRPGRVSSRSCARVPRYSCAPSSSVNKGPEPRCRLGRRNA